MFTNLKIIAQTEKDICLSQKRYWLLVVSIYLLAMAIYFFSTAIFANYSAFSTSVELVSPKNALLSLSQVCMVVFTIVATLLAIEVRARDTRERMHEVLDTRPLSNIDFVLGRFIGVFLVTWVPIALLPLGLQVVTWLMPLFGLPAESPLSWDAYIAFAFYVSVPTVAFCVSVTMFLAILFRNRFIAAVLSIGLVFLSMSLAESLPYVDAMMSDLFGISQLNLSSELDPSIAPSFWWLQRLAIICLSGAMLFMGVVVYPRLDSGNRALRGVASLSLLAIAALTHYMAYQGQNMQFQQVQAWAKNHRQQAFPRADIQSISAFVSIEPSKGIFVDMDMDILNANLTPLSALTFALNPGFEAVSATLLDGTPVSSNHEDGILTVSLDSPLKSGQSQAIKLTYKGIPDTRFAYLDSAIKLNERTKYDGSYKLKALGNKNAVLNDDIYTLMPGIYWLPRMGTGVSAEDKDFFNLELKVELPDTWLVAGPGQRQRVANSGKRHTFAFSPQVPVPEVALIGGKFESFKTVIKDIEFEVLISAENSRTITSLSAAKAPLTDWVESKLEQLADAGLVYPYQTFSLVEVPDSLRSYEGGWRMDTALAPPSMLLLREGGVPSARFDIDGSDNVYADLMGWSPTVVEGETKGQKLTNKLISYFENDFSSGNLYAAFSRSIYAHQTDATGQGREGLNHFLSRFTGILVSGKNHYFSVENDLVMDKLVSSLLKRDNESHLSLDEKILDVFLSKPSVWQLASDSSLADLQPDTMPTKALDLLELRAGRLAKLFYDELGHAKAGEFLADFIASHQGQQFTFEDVQSQTQSNKEQLTAALRTWFEHSQLPGYRVVDSQLYKLANSKSAETQYQLRLFIENPENVDGYVKIGWQTQKEGERFYTEPQLIKAGSIADYGLILSEPPVALYVYPYFSLNRKEFLAATFSKFNIPTKDLIAHHGIDYIAQDAKTENTKRIIADDLDKSFEIEETQPSNMLMAWLKPEKVQFKELDQGLPVSSNFLRYWSRKVSDNAYGHYRHTFVGIKAGQGETNATLATELPERGKWRLEVHMPKMNLEPLPKLGNWDMQVISNGEVKQVKFDASAGVNGWNHVEVFDLESGPVEVVVSNKSDGEVVIVDAISWTNTTSS